MRRSSLVSTGLVQREPWAKQRQGISVRPSPIEEVTNTDERLRFELRGDRRMEGVILRVKLEVEPGLVLRTVVQPVRP